MHCSLSKDDPEFETASEGEEEREESHQVKKGSMQTDSETRMAEASKEDVASVSVVASATTMTLRFAINGVCAQISFCLRTISLLIVHTCTYMFNSMV